MASAPADSDVKTPEYLAFQKNYELVIDCVKAEVGSFCDSLFAKGYIPTDVRDFIRTVGISDTDKARKLVDRVIDQIQHNQTVFHDFIDLLKKPSTDDIAKILLESYDAESKRLSMKHSPCLPQAGANDPRSSNDDSSFSVGPKLSDDDAGFVCPYCGECTIEKFFSEEGCPKKELPQKVVLFPHLDLSALSNEDKIDFEAKLRSDTRKMITRFAIFTVRVRDSLEDRNIPLQKIKDSVLSLEAFTEDIGIKVLEAKDQEKIMAANSVSEIFTILHRYMSFFNYHIVECLIDIHGSDEDHSELKEYQSAFKEFCQRNVFEVPSDTFSHKSRSGAKIFALKCSDRVSTLSGIQGVVESVAELLGLRPSALQLCSIKKGCVELHFLISPAVADRIFPVSPSQHSALSGIGVRVLSCECMDQANKQIEKSQGGRSFFYDYVKESKDLTLEGLIANELETCKEQLGQWELKAITAEAEVTSLGFQKVTMEQKIAKCKEEIKWLNEQLDAEREKRCRQSKVVLHKIIHVKNKMDELCKSEKEAEDSLDGVRFSVKQLKSGVISQERFFSQVETLFASIQSCYLNESWLGQEIILEDAKEPYNSLPPVITSTGTISPSPLPILPKGVVHAQWNESHLSEPKKSIPPPRKLLYRGRQISSPGSLGNSLLTEFSRVPSRVSPSYKRVSSRVASLYSLGAPPGTPALKSQPNKLSWSLPSTESEDSDFEPVTPPVQTVSSDSLDQLFNDPSNWHHFDDDSEEELYYINPRDVNSKSIFKDSLGLTDNNYMVLSYPQLDQDSLRGQRIGISMHSPSAPIYSLVRDVCEVSPGPTRSGLFSNATSKNGNEIDSEDNVYENPDDDDSNSPLFDDHMYLSNSVPVNYQDEIYTQIDEARDSYSPVSYSSSVPSSGVDRLKQAFVLPGDRDMQNEDGYTGSVCDIQHSQGIVPEQASLLPPQPPNFLGVKSGNPTRTIPGIGSLPRYTTLGGSEHQVRLVPLDQTSSWRHIETPNNIPLVSSSLPNTFHSPSPPSSTHRGNVQPKKLLQHSTTCPDLHKGGSQLDDRPILELPSNNSAFPRTSQPRSSTPPSAMQSSAKKISCNSPSSTQVHLEKSGYLILHELKQKPKRKWVVLSGTEVKSYYVSQKDHPSKKPRDVINLDKCSRSSVKGTKIQLVMPKKVYYLVAADKSECEAWLRVIEAAMQGVSVVANSSDEDPHITALSGWAHVKGISKTVWCFLEGHTLFLSPEPGAEPIHRLDVEKCSVKCKKGSIFVDSSHANLKAMVLSIRDMESKEVTILQPINYNVIEEWCYVLDSLRCGEESPELTRTEQVLSEIMKENPISHCDHPKWNNPIFKATAMPIDDSILSMPTVKLKKRSKGLFRDLQRFLNTTIDSSNMEFQMSLVQMLVSQCLTNSKLQNEIYCQLLRQMSGHTTPTATPVLQGWLLLFLLIPMYLPSRKIISWYLTTFLERSLSSKSPVICELAKNCQDRVKLCSTAGSRQCTPTFFELKALFEEFVTSPLTPPTGAMKTGVYLSDGSVHEVVFFAITTVSELMSQLAEKVGLPDSASTGFALMCDWPGVTDEILCCPFLESKVCDVISMWTLSMEDLNQHTQMMNLEQRNITFTYERRLAFKKRQGSESRYECVLLAHQISQDVLRGVYPVASKEAIRLAAIMAQLEYGDIESLPEGERERLAREAVERFCPWKLTYMALEHVRLQLLGDLKEKWGELAGKCRDECAQLYLSSVQVWSMCGATVFEAEQRASLAAPHQSVWLAIYESGVSLLEMKSMETIKSYNYNDVSTFGGHREDDFMLMVTPKDSLTEGTTEKLLFSMDKIHICEATFLMATYIARMPEKLNEA